MKGLVVLLALCAYTHAMVPMQRRAAVKAEEDDTLRPQSTAANKTQFCAQTTPCAWSIYKLNTKIVEFNLTNTYCVCSPDRSCQSYEDDESTTTLVFRCLKINKDLSEDTGPPAAD